MDENWDEEPDSARESEPFQYSLRTLMIAVTLAAVFFSFVAWWGLYPVVFLLGSALGTFLGLLLCSYIGLGFGFEDLRWDIAKCLIVPVVAILPIFLLTLIQLQYLPVHVFIIVSGLTYWFGMKLAWTDLESPEILISAVSSLFTAGFFVFWTYKIFGA